MGKVSFVEFSFFLIDVVASEPIRILSLNSKPTSSLAANAARKLQGAHLVLRRRVPCPRLVELLGMLFRRLDLQRSGVRISMSATRFLRNRCILRQPCQKPLSPSLLFSLCRCSSGSVFANSLYHQELLGHLRDFLLRPFQVLAHLSCVLHALSEASA